MQNLAPSYGTSLINPALVIVVAAIALVVIGTVLLVRFFRRRK